MKKNKTPEQRYQELKKAILEIKYVPSMRIDWPLEKLEKLIQSVAYFFPNPQEYNTLYEYYSKQRQEVFTDCLKHLLLQRKDRLKKLQIEYVVTSIFDYIFNFNLEKALTSIYGPNFRDVIEHQLDNSDVCLFVQDESKYGFITTSIPNRLIPECKIQDSSYGDKAVLDFEIVKEEIIKDKRIILMKSKSIYLLDICSKVENANFILLNTSPNARYYRSEEDALYFFEHLAKEISNND